MRVKKEWITEKEKLDANEILNWKNVEERNAGCQIIGWGKILDAVNAKVIHSDPNPYFGTLFEADLPDHGKQRFLKAKCGTGRDVVVLVHDMNLKTAREAGAATYGVDPKDYNPTIRT